MNKRKSLVLKFKRGLTIAAVAIFGVFSLGFVDSYFEISKNLKILNDIYRELHTYYVEATVPGDLMKKSIDSMLSSLDPYTTYIPESDIEDYRFMTTGQYGGIGALIRKDEDFVIIAEPYEGFPAQKAGLVAGDKILKIDGESTKNKSTADVSKVLKGQPGTRVSLTIERQGEESFVKQLVREEVKIPSVPYSGMLSDEIGYIKLTSFTETAGKEVKDHFNKLKSTNQMSKLIFDLRGNGGGLLREAVNIVNLFVNKGEEIVSTRGRIKDWDKTYKAINAPLDLEIPVIILLDGQSASASEIVGGAMQDLDRGIIVGQRSFGKGLVQQTRNLDYNSKLKLTVAKYYIPSGRCIQRIDYAHRDDDGNAEEVPDSAITVFRTKNGREVHDGKGIAPDIKVKLEQYSKIASALAIKNHIFDYATKYRREHESIVSPQEFKLSNEDYAEFKNFIKGKDYSYETGTEKALADLKEIAEKEKYFAGGESEFEALSAKLAPSNDNDLEKFKSEIVELLEEEIISRYYFQNGRIEASLGRDPYIEQAVSLLNDSERFSGVLRGKQKDKK